MARDHLVLRSINAEEADRCVDIFRRPDGSFGFEEYRRDVEDGRGWFAIGGQGTRAFATEGDALAAALLCVPWLRAAAGSRPPA
jgi:hypothetical protein